MRKYLFLLLVVSVLTSCEVEFSPNAIWKDVPVVYCLLDQDDSITWARVQRCYLAEGNVYQYGQCSDSINYPCGAITVTLLCYRGAILVDSIVFRDTLLDISGGTFAYDNQPLYYCCTDGRLKEDCTYALSVRKSVDGSLLAYTDAISLVKKTSESLITRPSVTVTLNGDTTSGSGMIFNDAYGMGSATYCQIQWNKLDNARLYLPVIRFYYAVDGETEYVDIRCPSVSAKYNELYYPRDYFLAQIKEAFKDDTLRRKMYLPWVDVYLTCCSEELNVYIYNLGLSASVSQMAEAYNNIKGGVGLFAARRTHLFKHMPADQSIEPGKGLRYFLQELNVGIY